VLARRRGDRNEVTSWTGIGAPKNTPADIVDKTQQGDHDPKVKARLAELGSTPLVNSPGDLAKLIVDDTEKWGKVIRAANIKPE
jgi:tripartite-type tricarboxylate transporter receptor subunit TctC